MKKNTIAYDILYKLNIATAENFSYEIKEGGKVEIIDNNKYQVIFDLQNSVRATSTYDIENDIDVKDLHQNNYVAIMRDDKSIVQIWGKKDYAIIEIRKHLYEALECENVKLFRECEKNIYKHVKREYQLIARDTDIAVKLINEFLKRLEKRTKGEETTATETTATASESA